MRSAASLDLIRRGDKQRRHIFNDLLLPLQLLFAEVTLHSSACEVSPLRASSNFGFKLGGKVSSFRHRNAPFSRLLFYHNLVLEGGPNFRWQYSTLNKITTDFSDTVETAIADSHRGMEAQRSALAVHANTLQATIDELAQRVDGMMREVSDTIDTSQSSMNDQGQELLRLTQQLQLNFRAFERTLETELTKSIQILGGHLAALSEKFVENYTSLSENYASLTEELYRLVNPTRSDRTDDDVPW